MVLSTAGIASLLASASSSFAHQPVVEGPKGVAPPSGSITGHDLNANGEAVPGAAIFVATIGVAASPRTALTDNAGYFKLDELDAAVYYVWAHVPGFVSDTEVSLNDSR